MTEPLARNELRSRDLLTGRERVMDAEHAGHESAGLVPTLIVIATGAAPAN